MSSRRDEKERLRRERLAQEQAQSRAAARRRWVQIGTAGAAVAIVAVIVIVIAASGGGGSSTSGPTYSTNSVPPGAEVGVTDKPPPWPPNYDHLAERLKAMGLPQLNEEIFHIHALLHIYINGKPVTVPPNVGLDAATNTFSPLHTHDTSGIIHMEADRTYSFTLGQFFAVWGVKFSDRQIGPYKARDGDQLQVYVNGQRVSDPVNLVMQEHDSISVGYGKPGSFPNNPPARFPSEL